MYLRVGPDSAFLCPSVDGVDGVAGMVGMGLIPDRVRRGVTYQESERVQGPVSCVGLSGAMGANRGRQVTCDQRERKRDRESTRHYSLSRLPVCLSVSLGWTLDLDRPCEAIRNPVGFALCLPSERGEVEKNKAGGWRSRISPVVEGEGILYCVCLSVCLSISLTTSRCQISFPVLGDNVHGASKECSSGMFLVPLKKVPRECS